MDNQEFNYSYSAEENSEILAIQKKYTDEKKPVGTLEELRRLDKNTARPALIVGWAVGIIGTLVMGTGMSMVMTSPNRFFILGIIVGVIGMVLMAVAFPIYKMVLDKQKKKNASKILELTEKLLRQ